MLLLLTLSACPASASVVNARLEDFVAGVRIRERIRLRVKDIVAGKTSVRYLFKAVEQREPTRWEYYSGAENTLNLMLTAPGKVEELRAKLIAGSKELPHADNQYLLRVVLEDDTATFLRRLFPDRFAKDIVIAIEMPCEEMTHVIYRRINEIVKGKVREALKKGVTQEEIELDEVFEELLRGELEQYIDSLGPSQAESPCSKTFRLLKWLRGEDVPGFEFGEYELSGELKSLLQPVTDALNETHATSERYDLKVKIVGYTDEVPVRAGGIELRREKTGVDDWNHLTNFPDIKYGGCDGDHAGGDDPVYVALSGGQGRQVRGRIYNNCELGAVRAYVATGYLATRLGHEGASYSYATGGIYSNADQKSRGDDRGKRKVEIAFTINAARVER
jgi:hypothetical protein